MTFISEEDGITHINIYSKGKTELGRLMSNFALSPFSVPQHGEFKSIEGYWYWLSTGDESLRDLYGYEAKKAGRKLRGDDWSPDTNLYLDFRQCIIFI